MFRRIAVSANRFSYGVRSALSRSVSTTSAPPVISTISGMRKQRELWQPSTVGFVPTMGALHSGHLELVKRARSECDRVCVSIYVNPTQFGVGEDFGKYPRQLERDCTLLTGLADAVFAPSDSMMYRRSASNGAAAHATYVTVDGLHVDSTGATAEPASGVAASAEAASKLTAVEARVRPTHFRGVATVVTKLFNIVQPTRSYFGAKDGMQCILIRRIVRELNQPTKVVVCPTIRESDGLAMSSRNVYLSQSERAIAPKVYRALQAGRARFDSGDRTVAGIQQAVTSVLAAEPAFTIQYVSVADTQTGAELLAGNVLRATSTSTTTDSSDDDSGSGSGVAMLSVAVKLGNTRLIDNIILGGSEQ